MFSVIDISYAGEIFQIIVPVIDKSARIGFIDHFMNLEFQVCAKEAHAAFPANENNVILAHIDVIIKWCVENFHTVFTVTAIHIHPVIHTHVLNSLFYHGGFFSANN